MIVPMIHVTLLCMADARAEALGVLRDMGLVHLNLEATDSEHFREAQATLAAVRRAQQLLTHALADKPVAPALAAPHRAPGHVQHVTAMLTQKLPAIGGTAAERTAAILHLADIRQELVNEAARLEHELERYAPFGAFDVTQPARLARQGVAVTLFRAPHAARLQAPEGALLQIVATDAKHAYGVLIGNGRLAEPHETLDLPEAGIDILKDRREQALARIVKISDTLKRDAADTAVLDREALRLTDVCEFAAATDTMQQQGAVVWITGWVPADQEALLRETAADQAWGLLLRDPTEGEQVPTLLRPPRLFRPMQALFDALGISPAYTEADVSVPFFCFFSIFFAMLVGDGGYGALILLLTWRARKKYAHAPRAPFILLTVFSVATVLWGVLSNTWFGTHPKAMNNAASLWLSDPEHGNNNMMLVCFTLGVVHLSVARLWNVLSLFPDSKSLAQLGWVGILWFMYCMTCQVIGIFPTPRPMYVIFGASLLLVFIFTLKRKELRTNGIELGMLPLTVIGSLGDIISYVRLFAVGLASVKVAENFNHMAVNLGLPLWAKIVPMLLILLVGHGLNFAMAGLSILVHAVRLNTLEFSNHKGVTWSGFAFRPFKRRASAN